MQIGNQHLARDDKIPVSYSEGLLIIIIILFIGLSYLRNEARRDGDVCGKRL